jgi:16S rRNA (guanine1207-N2)-methyltransferase
MIETVIKSVPLRFETAPEVFSPGAVDPGTLAMLSAVEFEPGDYVLDLGCGYGAVGILAARLIGCERVVMLDVDPAAVALTKRNAALNGLEGITIAQGDGPEALDSLGGLRDFTLILSNPPYHADFSVPKRFIAQGWERLSVGGRMVMVTKRRAWYENRLRAVFGGVRVAEIDGYFVFTAEKREGQAHAPKAKGGPGLSKKLQRKMRRGAGPI